MSERKFLNYIFIEGLLLTILGLCILILPKLTSLTFGVMIASSFIAYGVYKIVMTIINRHYLINIFWHFFMGIFILTLGVLLLAIPQLALAWLIALIGVYFLLSSISLITFISHIQNVFNYTCTIWFAAFVLFLTGLIIIVGLPLVSFWTVAILSGISLTIKGLSKMTLALSNKNNFSM